MPEGRNFPKIVFSKHFQGVMRLWQFCLGKGRLPFVVFLGGGMICPDIYFFSTPKKLETAKIQGKFGMNLLHPEVSYSFFFDVWHLL